MYRDVDRRAWLRRDTLHRRPLHRDALHRDVEFSATMERAIQREIAALADALDLELVRAEGA